MGAFGMGAAASPYGAPPSPPQAYGSAQQPPRFSAGSLISDGDLPAWLREPGDGAAASQQAGWAAPAPAQPQPAMNTGWPPAPEPPRADPSAQHTVRQPAVGSPGPAAPQYPAGQQQPGYGQQPPAPAYQQAGYPQQAPAYPPQPASAQQPGYSQPAGYPPQPGFMQPAGYAQQQGHVQPAYPPQPVFSAPQGYPQQPASGAYAYPGLPQPPAPASQVNAFPAIEQAGTAYHGPQQGGMAGHALLDQQALPNWLAGGAAAPVAPRAPVPSGMMARSLVDDQALPKWLRDQPDNAAHANVSEWIGASAAHEPMPQFLSEAYAQASVGRAPQQFGAESFQAPAQPSPQPYGGDPFNAIPQPPQRYGADPFNAPMAAPMAAPDPVGGARFGAAAPVSSSMRNGGAQPGYGEDTALPEWLRAQAGAGAGPAASEQAPVVGFAASDLIDPSALPEWVTQRAPAPQTFSSTQGWSVAQPEPAMPEPEPAYGGAEPAYDQGYEQGYDQGYDQDASAQAPWGASAQWDGGAQNGPMNDPMNDSMYYDQRGAESQYGRGRPLDDDELPPWLRGKGGGQPARAPSGRAAPNPWAAASEPAAFAGGWDDGDAWGEPSNQANDGWNDAGSWDDSLAPRRRPEPDDAWGRAAPRDDWSEQRRAPSRGNGARGGRSGRVDEDLYAGRGRSQRGYDERYAGADDELDYGDEEPADDQRGRGWLGFLRRDKR